MSNVRTGIESGQIENISTDTIDRLMVAVEPATLMLKSGKNLTADERDIERANMIKAEL